MRPDTGSPVATAEQPRTVCTQVREAVQRLQETVAIECGIQRQLGILEPDKGAEGKDAESTVDSDLRRLGLLANEVHKRLCAICSRLGD